MLKKVESKALNVLGGELQDCSFDPVTGFFRDGCCNTNAQDVGSHTICVRLTEEFLQFSKATGNDLSTPMPQFNFPGLNPGDQWCLCAVRWLQAFDQNMAPSVRLTATHERALDIVPLEALKAYALDLN
ncbi:MAG: DUF2237 domain-containing protein [Arenicellaceae bacterium]|jgi:uncharacterized protein (DUF2237 family)|nr:DUF2237 domain-containing protein [Arenicellaceae bacterium]